MLKKLEFKLNSDRFSSNRIVILSLELRDFLEDTKTTRLKPIKKGYRFSMCFERGQSLGATSTRLVATNKSFRELVNIWRRWHLNDMNGASRDQHIYLKAIGNTDTDFPTITRILSQAGLNEPYRYGTARLVKVIPDSVVNKIIKYCKELHNDPLLNTRLEIEYEQEITTK